MEPLGKPSGIPLAAHRQHVLDESKRLLGALPYLAEKYAALVPGADLRQRVLRAAWYHDWGKEHPNWQTACQRDYRLYQDWRRRRGLDPDTLSAGDWDSYYWDTRNTGPNLRDAKLRHEFDSLCRCDEDDRIDLSLAERVAIAAHHGKLSARHERRWRTDAGGEFEPTWTGLQREWLTRTRALRRDLAASARQRYETAGVRALLRLADSRASRAEAGGELAAVLPFEYEYPYAERRKVQDLALKHAEDWVTILRAPTGSGKTAAARLWGQRQTELGRADRLVIAMPTRFTANALALAPGDAPEQTGLYHSSAWHARFGDLGRRDPAHDLAREHHALARLLATPTTVCTVDHLLIALTGTREDHHATFFFLANAAVVFDEVDFYEPFVQANLTVLLAVLRALRVPVLLMSATVPESARQLYGVDAEVRQSTAQASGRRWLYEHPPVENPEDAAEVLDRMIEEGTGIVYANTVERAYRYWRYLREQAGDLPVYLYHSRFTEPDKKTIEDALVGNEDKGVLGALGRRAWEAGAARGVAVFTQIGEMSINVSAPLMLSDLCPWDRLAQRAGRLARFEDLIPEGELYVAAPHRKGELYPAPYGSFDGPAQGWAAGEPLLETARRLAALLADGPFEVTPELLVREVNALYPEAAAPDARARTNARTLREMICENWMIVPKTDPDEDEATVGNQWKSRDIPPQATLLVLHEEDLPEGNTPYRFRTWPDYHGFVLERGIACPHYLLKRAIDRDEVTRFCYTIGNDPETQKALAYLAYDAPENGIGSGLGALSARFEEDSPGAAIL
ncbi:MAG: CRISPR-associated helicase Cas3' [Bacteroidota bacterium]